MEAERGTRPHKSDKLETLAIRAEVAEAMKCLIWGGDMRQRWNQYIANSQFGRRPEVEFQTSSTLHAFYHGAESAPLQED